MHVSISRRRFFFCKNLIIFIKQSTYQLNLLLSSAFLQHLCPHLLKSFFQVAENWELSLASVTTIVKIKKIYFAIKSNYNKLRRKVEVSNNNWIYLKQAYWTLLREKRTLRRMEFIYLEIRLPPTAMKLLVVVAIFFLWESFIKKQKHKNLLRKLNRS